MFSCEMVTGMGLGATVGMFTLLLSLLASFVSF